MTLTCAGGAPVRASYVVVCAGASCTELRARLGVAFEGRSFDDRFLTCDVLADLPGRVAERHFHFDPAWNPGWQVLIHPCPGSSYRIDWQVPPGFDLDTELASGGLDRRVRQVLGDVDHRVGWTTVYRFHSRCVDRMRIGRALLGGDAAHLMSPFGARGLNSGVADAENAAWKIAFVARGWAPDVLLDSYHHERHAAAWENLAVTTATMDFLVPGDAARAAHRSGSSTADLVWDAGSSVRALPRSCPQLGTVRTHTCRSEGCRSLLGWSTPRCGATATAVRVVRSEPRRITEDRPASTLVAGAQVRVAADCNRNRNPHLRSVRRPAARRSR